MKKTLNFLFLLSLSTNSTVLLTSCANKLVNSKNTFFEAEPLPSQNQQMLKSFLNQLDFEGNELEGNELNGAMKFDEYKNIAEKKILNYITDNFNSEYKIEVNLKKSTNTLEEDKCKINCEISCSFWADCAKKDFDIKFKNVKSKTNLISLEEIKKKLTVDSIEGSTLDQLASIGSKANKDEILRLIKNIVNNNDIKVELLVLPETNLSLTDNKVNIRISHNLENKDFDVTFKNVKSYSESQIDDLLKSAKTKIVNNLAKLAKQISEASSNKQMLLEIEEVIKDKRINVKVIQEVENEAIIQLLVNHKYILNKCVKLKIKDLPINWNKLLIDIEKKLTKNPIDCKKLIKDDLNLRFGTNRELIKNIIEQFINDNNVSLSVLTYFDTLNNLGNKIKVKIANKVGNEERQFNVVLNNLKKIELKQLDQTKLKSLQMSSLKLLIGYNSIINTGKSAVKKLYFDYQKLLHPNNLKTFFQLWWKKVKKLDFSTETFSKQFNTVYSLFSRPVFSALLTEKRTVEAILQKTDNFNDDFLNENEEVNQFYRYLEEINKIISSKYDAYDKFLSTANLIQFKLDSILNYDLTGFDELKANGLMTWKQILSKLSNKDNLGKYFNNKDLTDKDIKKDMELVNFVFTIDESEKLNEYTTAYNTNGNYITLNLKISPKDSSYDLQDAISTKIKVKIGSVTSRRY